MGGHRCFTVRLWARGIEAAVHHIVEAAVSGACGYGCFANAHMVGESRRNRDLLRAMREATWVFPDGRPVAVLMRWRGALQAGQVPGPETVEGVLPLAAARGLPVYLFGGNEEILQFLHRELPQRYRGLKIAGAFSPPFRNWTPEEEAADAARIRSSGAKICLVALGCPKQELWMWRNATACGCICLGVGAAFPMLAGRTPRAPKMVRAVAMEWMWRWIQEPRRLTHRYTVGNFRFGAAVWRELQSSRRKRVITDSRLAQRSGRHSL